MKPPTDSEFHLLSQSLRRLESERKDLLEHAFVDIYVSFIIKYQKSNTCNSYDMPPKIDEIPPFVLIVEDDRSCRESNKLFRVYSCNVDNSYHATSSLKVKSKKETSPRRVKISAKFELNPAKSRRRLEDKSDTSS